MSSVSCLVIGDPHFRPTKHPRIYDEMEKQICALITSQNPSFVVVLGDVFHDHNIVHVQMLLRVRNFFGALQRVLKDRPLYVLVGNHDMENNMQFLTEKHAMSTFKGRLNLHIIDKPLVVNHKGYNFVMVPYVPPGRFQEALDTVKMPDSVTAIFAHQEFYGARLGPTTSIHGDKWDLESCVVISGHVHDAHSPQSNIIYVGTPVQHSYGEDGDKAVGLFTFDNERYTYQREPLILAKHHTHQLYLESDNLDQLTSDVLKQQKSKKDDTHRIVVRGNMAEIQAFRKSTIAKKLQKSHVKLVYKNIEHESISDTTVSFTDVTASRQVFVDKLRDRCSGESSEYKDALQSLLVKIVGN